MPLNEKAWFSVAKTFGVPTVILAALMFAGYRACSWTADNIFLPALQAHTKVLDEIGSTQKQIVNVQEKQNATTDMMHQRITTVEEIQREAITILKERLPAPKATAKTKTAEDSDL